MRVPNLDGSESEFVPGKKVAFNDTNPPIGEFFYADGSYWRRIGWRSPRNVTDMRKTYKYSFGNTTSKRHALNALAYPKRGEALNAGHRTPAPVFKARRAWSSARY